MPAKVYVRKDDDRRVYLPGEGYVRAGKRLVGDEWAKYCPDLLEEASDVEASDVVIEAVVVPPPLPSDLLVEDYDDMNAKKSIAVVADLPEDELQEMLAYEKAHKNRKTVIEEIEKLLEF